MTTTPGKPWLERGHHSWCALSDDNHRGPCEAVAENKVIHREPRPRLAQPAAEYERLALIEQAKGAER
jgi:hypothetical protein